jgi:hypothetical protein
MILLDLRAKRLNSVLDVLEKATFEVKKLGRQPIDELLLAQ